MSCHVSGVSLVGCLVGCYCRCRCIQLDYLFVHIGRYALLLTLAKNVKHYVPMNK